MNAVWFPWLEANQGFLSLLALTSALAIALYEHVRAESADYRARAQPVLIALELVDELRAAVENAATPDRFADHKGGLALRSDAAEPLMRAMATANPPSAAFAVAALRAADAMKNASVYLPHATSPKPLTDFLDKLTAVRKSIAACRPRPRFWEEET